MTRILLTLIALSMVLTAIAQTSGNLMVTATTSKTTTPTYAPRNIVAIWVEDANGNFVKTLLSYASERRQYLKEWRTKTTIAGSAYNTTDAITGATQSSHAARTASWNGKNRLQALVADGAYILKMEVTDNDGIRQNLATFNFTKGTSIQTLTPANTNGFSSISISWTPSTTSVNDNAESEIFSMYPTSTKTQLFVYGTAVQKVEIADMNGRILLRTNKSIIPVSELPAALYFANIYTTQGVFVRRFIKE